jgi:hypothetical protein
LGTSTQTSAISSETVRWFGPLNIFDGTTGVVTGPNTFTDLGIGVDFGSAGVQAGDLLLIKPATPSSGNDYAVATVQTTPSVGATSLTCTNILTIVNTSVFVGSAVQHSYVIVRPTATQLFAVPNSGVHHGEQTFLFVRPGSSLHSTTNPTIDQINADRVTDIVPPFYNGTGVDRADSVFAANHTTLDKLGYRLVLYPDNGSGAPDFTKPILTSTPKINTTIPLTDQRMTVDYRAGVVRFSCAPSAGGDINPASVYSSVGRVNLWGVFWAFDQTLTKGSARGLFDQRSTEQESFAPAQVRFSNSNSMWFLGSTDTGNDLYVSALGSDETTAATDQTEIGVFDTATGGRRYFKYVGGSNRWTFRQGGDEFDSLQYAEVPVGDKLALTVGDGTAPRVNPGADFNPTTAYSGTSIGLRNSRDAIDAALKAAFISGTPVAHLKRGRYYVDKLVNIPPGVVLEGDGASTKVFAKANASLDFGPIFKVGPNAPWGVYDPTYDSTSGSNAPLEFVFASNHRIEGFDVVWNPTRRVWGVVQADITSNAIWFNEVRPDGTTVLPGLGINVKTTSTALFTSNSIGATNHTASHYPRMAYQEANDEYAIVYVDQHASLNGPTAKLQVVSTTQAEPPLTFATRFATPVALAGTESFTDHPSVAVDNANNASDYGIAVSFWNYSSSLGVSKFYAQTIDSIAGTPLITSSDSLGANHVCSSTDVAEDNAGGFLWTYSDRSHPLYTGTAGVISGGVGNFSDATFTGSTPFTTSGIEVGSRFLCLGGSAYSGGTDGAVFQVVSNTVLKVIPDVTGSYADSVNPLTWAITPRIQVWSKRFYGTLGSIGSRQGVITQDPTSTFYRMEVREPDFVRISRGGNNWLLVYQAYDSTSFLSQDSVKNFDNGIDTALVDSAGLTLKDRQVYRDHIGTCALLLTEGGLPAYPLAGEDIFISDTETHKRDINVTARSLGGRDPLLVAPNGIGTAHFTKSPNRLISARNTFHRWTSTDSPSLIPDVTWTGQDWVVVSPSKHEIHSYTGTFTISGGQNYIHDPSFYFGDDALVQTATSGGYKRFLRRTVRPGTDQIKLLATGAVLNITTVVSEHGVQVSLASGSFPSSGTTNLEWVLVKPNTYGAAGNIKNPGFRVGSDGRLISATSYMTFADEVDEGSSLPRRTELMLRKNGNGLNTPSDLNLGYNDIAYSQSAIWGDVSFKGVAVGAPKGCADNNSTLNERPKVAIAWGDTMYGFMDRVVTGGGLNVANKTAFYRQSFGPYGSGLRNLSIVGANSANTPLTTYLQMLSQERVFTRHGGAATPGGNFATDGYRNCFATPVVTDVSTTDSSSISRYPGAIQAYYTDANGSQSIALRGPKPVQIPEYNIYADYINDLFADLPNPSGAPTNDDVMARSKPTTPVLLWDGTRFVAAWTETNNFNTGSAGAKAALVCLGSLPGGEDQFIQGQMITGDTNIPQQVVEFASVSTGNTNTDSPGRATFAVDMAFSGEVYAVLWTGGHNPTSTANTGGSAIGVAIFYGTGQKSAACSYLIDSSDKRCVYQDGKILWDGRQFVAVWRQQDSGTGKLYMSVIPEHGFGAKMALKRLSAPATGSGTSATLGLGTVSGGAGANPTIDTSANPIPCQPGDLVQISNLALSGGGFSTIWNGWYVVKDYNPITHVITLHTDTSLGTGPFSGTAAATHTVIGAVFSGNQGDPASLESSNGASTVNQAVTTTLFKPQLIGSANWGTANRILGDIDRIDGFAYNEIDDEYAVLIRKSSSGILGLTTWKRGSQMAGPEHVFVVSGSPPGVASMAWNGRQYLVAWNDEVIHDIRYQLINARGQADDAGFIASASQVIGSGNNMIPGPSYDALVGANKIQPRVRNICVKWNNRLNRWVVSASFLWYDEVVGATSNTQLYQFMTPQSGNLNVASFSARTIGLDVGSGAVTNFLQVGVRLIGFRGYAGGTQTVYSPTIKKLSGANVITDTSFTEMSADAQANFGITGGPLPLTVAAVLREDVLCWTLGYKAPAVQLLDADSVALENVDFSGGYVDVEERYRNLARPIFQAGGMAFGKPNGTFWLPGHVNHLFLTPSAKVAAPVFSNVRSLTAARHGQGAPPGVPHYNKLPLDRAGRR